MSSLESDKVFAGSIPEMYNKYLVPLIFEPQQGIEGGFTTQPEETAFEIHNLLS